MSFDPSELVPNPVARQVTMRNVGEHADDASRRRLNDHVDVFELAGLERPSVDRERRVDDRETIEGQVHSCASITCVDLREIADGAIANDEMNTRTPELELLDVDSAAEQCTEGGSHDDSFGIREATVDRIIEGDVFGDDPEWNELEMDTAERRAKSEFVLNGPCREISKASVGF